MTLPTDKVLALRDALAYLLGPIDDEKVGWRGRNPPTNNHFSCEFCAKSHLDCTLIEHQDDCPVTIARATLAGKNDAKFSCIGVIDSNGDIYPEPPEAGTNVYIRNANE